MPSLVKREIILKKSSSISHSDIFIINKQIKTKWQFIQAHTEML